MALTRGTQVATIDVVLVTLITQPEAGQTAQEIAIETGNQVNVTAVLDTQDNINLINRSTGVLLAQKRGKVTVTGNTLVIRDNVFTPEVALILQGGQLDRDSNGVPIHYQPPVAGEVADVPYFDVACYSAQYNAAGKIVRYEKITYPNGKGNPVTLNTEDNVFRIPEYTINSAPEDGEPPYMIDWVDTLPVVAAPTP